MDYLKYVDSNSLLHKLDPRTKFAFFVVMAVVTSLIKSFVALLFLLVFFLGIWKSCNIGKQMMVLLSKLKILLLFIFFLWFVLGLFQVPAVSGGPVFYQTQFSFAGRTVDFCFDWYDFYKGAVYSLRIFLMIASFYTVLLTTNFSEMILGLRKWHMPYSIAFGIGLVFQVIPIVIAELQAIMDAQSSRGLEIDKCSWTVKVRNYVTFSFPLLFRVISKGQSISLAMHYYKLDFSKKRSAYKAIKESRYDAYFIAANIFAIAITIFLRIMYYIPV